MVEPIKDIFFTSLSAEDSKKLILSCFNNMGAKIISENSNKLIANETHSQLGKTVY